MALLPLSSPIFAARSETDGSLLHLRFSHCLLPAAPHQILNGRNFIHSGLRSCLGQEGLFRTARKQQFLDLGHPIGELDMFFEQLSILFCYIAGSVVG